MEEKKENESKEEGRSRCVICLSDDSLRDECTRSSEDGSVKIDMSGCISNIPLISIRILCGEHVHGRFRVCKQGICNCRYNIHTSCFVKSNQIFNNVCPICRNKWWMEEDQSGDCERTDQSGMQSNNLFYRILNVSSYWPALFIPLLFVAFISLIYYLSR